MKNRTFARAAITTLLALAAPTLSRAQQGGGEASRTHSGRALAYRQIDEASLETLSTPDRIKRLTVGSVAPTEIWRTLEHGEKVECLDCIPSVSKLLYDGNEKTREISAWWLRRRIFGVFGPGEVYSQVVDTLGDGAQPERRRAHAAEAIGEFLVRAGQAPLARAILEDESPLVRRSAVRALERMNSEGPAGELSEALADPDEGVQLAAVHASTRVNVFTGVPQLAALVDDGSSAVRTGAIEALGALRSRDAVVTLIAKLSADNEPAASVRAAAAAALGEIGDPSARDALRASVDGDADRFVRDAARVALRRL